MNVTTALALSALIGLAPGADLHRVEIKEITTTIQQTPRYEVAGLKDKPFDPRYWLEIEAELEVESLTETDVRDGGRCHRRQGENPLRPAVDGSLSDREGRVA